ncbi:MAG: hypothetical protein M4D80_04710 [Myxococcota bacterium]|nr:hypothetical protein [Deltaproteobacteria bacterium]MDQ3334440.1 hypothetical protein [Myxococcota bacterium]
MLVLLVACGGGTDAPSIDAPIAVDAAIDAPAPTFMTCTGACKTTTLSATFASTRGLDKAYYGVTQSPPSLHVEAYKNPPAGCPTAMSPNPDYTLILGRVPIPTDATPSTSPGNILDFKGDLLASGIGAAATAVTITPTAAHQVTATGGFVALDVMLTFAGGSVSGHLYATHCASMDAAN